MCAWWCRLPQPWVCACCAGLEELCRKDPRFSQFHHSLFSAATTTFSRESQTADVLAALDEQIDAFLLKLSIYFLAPPAFKALEYLIRRYRCVAAQPQAQQHQNMCIVSLQLGQGVSAMPFATA